MVNIVKGVSRFLPNLKNAHVMRIFLYDTRGGISKALPEGSKATFDEYVRAHVDLLDMACE